MYPCYTVLLWLCRTSSGLKELEEEAARIRRWTEEQLSNTAQTQTQNRQQLHTLLQGRMVKSESLCLGQMRYCILTATETLFWSDHYEYSEDNNNYMKRDWNN